MGTREASGVLIVSPFLGSGYWGTFIELYTEELHTLCILYSMTIYFKKKKNVYSALLLACCWFLAIPPQTLCLSHPAFLSLGLWCSLSLLCSCEWLLVSPHHHQLLWAAFQAIHCPYHAVFWWCVYLPSHCLFTF